MSSHSSDSSTSSAGRDRRVSLRLAEEDICPLCGSCLWKFSPLILALACSFYPPEMLCIAPVASLH
jgi:hypothetical protein